MSTRPLLLLLLLVFNALAFVVARGWVDGTPPAGEAERLASQLNRERIRLVSELPAAPPSAGATSPSAAPAAPPVAAPVAAPVAPPVAAASRPAAASGAEAKAAEPATASAVARAAAMPGCIAWKNLPPPLAATLVARLNALRVTSTRTEAAVKWWVRIPPQGSREQAERVMTKLRAQGVADSFITPATAPAPFAISLGLFKTEKAAQQLLGQLEARGVRNAGIEVRTNPDASRIEARLRPEQASALERLHPAIAPHRTACAN
jgi:hypothetical protein